MTGSQPTVARTFVESADTLVADFDLVEFRHQLTVRSQQILQVDAVGLLLADNRGGLNVMATIGLLHKRAMHNNDLLAEQLQTALNSRLAIEQAKGIVAERADITVGAAFDLLRAYARNHDRKLHDLTRAVVDRDPVLGDLVVGSHRRPAG